MNTHSRPVPSKPTVHRLWVTLTVVAICLGARFIPLPVPAASNPRYNIQTLNLGSLGTQPFESGFVLVEFVALLVPALRRLRTGSPAQRANLYRAAVVVGVLITLFQIGTVEMMFRFERSNMNGFESLFRIAALTGMGLAYAFLASWVDRAGVGVGSLVVVSTGWITSGIDWIWSVWTAHHSGALSQAALDTLPWVVVIPAGCALWLSGPYSLPNTDGTEARQLSRPVCGGVALTIFPALILFLQLLASKLRQTDGPAFTASPATLSALTMGAIVAFAYCFHRPAWVERWWKSLLPSHTGPIPRWHSGLLEAVLFAGIITGITLWMQHRMPPSVQINPLHIVMFTVLAREFWLEWKRHQSPTRWVPVWDIHQSYATAPALKMLGEAGVRAEAANRNLRGLLQIFGPYAPIRIYVPEPDADQAKALFRERWPGLQR